MAKIFEPYRPVRAFKSLADELDAIARGDKPISWFASERKKVDSNADLKPITRAALDRGLAVTLAPRDTLVDLFIHFAAAARRITPLQTLLARSPWTFTLEAELSRQLGYAPKQRTAWIAAEKHRVPAYGCVTLYAIAPKSHRRLRNDTFVFTRPGDVAIHGATATDPEHPMVRFGLPPLVASKLLRGGKSGMISSSWFERHSTRVQTLTPNGWR